jgi:hypothetical protein
MSWDRLTDPDDVKRRLLNNGQAILRDVRAFPGSVNLLANAGIQLDPNRLLLFLWCEFG